MAKAFAVPLNEGENQLDEFGGLVLTDSRLIQGAQQVHIFGFFSGDANYTIMDLPSVQYVEAGEYMSKLKGLGIVLLGLIIFKLDVFFDLLRTWRMRPWLGNAVAVQFTGGGGSISAHVVKGSNVNAAREFVRKSQEAKFAILRARS